MSDLNTTATLPVAKPASQSRTLRFNNFVMWLAGIVGLLPDIIGWCLTALGDPSIASAVSDAIPTKYRVGFGIVMALVASRNKQLRYQTTQPIEKPAA